MRHLPIALPLLFLLLQLLAQKNVAAIAHDSLYCETDKTDRQNCAEPSHYVLELAKRDDELAKRYADEHGMIIKGKPFLDSHYFIYPQTGGELRRRSLDELVNRAEVVNLIMDRPRKRVKRDYISDQSFVGPQPEERIRRQTTFFERREVPKLPFVDPFYQDQWYLVGGAVGNFDMNVRETWLMGYAGRNVSC